MPINTQIMHPRMPTIALITTRETSLISQVLVEIADQANCVVWKIFHQWWLCPEIMKSNQIKMPSSLFRRLRLRYTINIKKLLQWTILLSFQERASGIQPRTKKVDSSIRKPDSITCPRCLCQLSAWKMSRSMLNRTKTPLQKKISYVLWTKTGISLRRQIRQSWISSSKSNFLIKNHLLS